MTTKYKKYYASQYEFPTKFIWKAGVAVGHVAARKFLEKKHSIVFPKDVKIRTRGGNWVFYQPIKEKENVSENS